MKNIVRLKISYISAISLLAFPILYSAESEAAEEVMDEVVVTARKIEESLLDIPESVQAIGGAAIDRQNIKSLEDVGFLIPNLNELCIRLD